MKNINEGATIEGLAMLIESSMERAELVMASKSITDKLQDMAETLAKIEASDVMPMMDSMKENFGPQVAQNFESVVTQKLRELTESLRQAKDAIGNEILRMETSVNGGDASDMGMADVIPPAEPAADAPAADAAPADAAPAANAGEAADDIEGMPTDAEIDDMFADADGPPVGRVRKESVEHVGSNALRESADPDHLVLRSFARVLREGHSATKAANAVAAFYGIDVGDVVDIVRDSRKA